MKAQRLVCWRPTRSRRWRILEKEGQERTLLEADRIETQMIGKHESFKERREMMARKINDGISCTVEKILTKF